MPDRNDTHRTTNARARRAGATRRRRARLALKRHAGHLAAGAIALTLVVLAVVLGNSAAAPGASGPGPQAGDRAPGFALTDAISGEVVRSEDLRGRTTLIAFTEGVYCQACMVQVADLERDGVLEREGIDLLHVSTDNRGDLATAARQYGIERTPLLSDRSTRMSDRYGMLGHGGMGHPDTNGHAFMLIDADGTVRWHRAYQEMYVETDRLMADMRAEAQL